MLMLLEALYYVLIAIVSVLGIMMLFVSYRRLLSKFLGQKILDELARLKVSAPNVTSTFDSNSVR